MVDFPEFDKTRIVDCVESTVSDVTTTICVKSPEVDFSISGNLILGKHWEYEITENIIKAMRDFPSATFLGNKTLLLSNLGILGIGTGLTHA